MQPSRLSPSRRDRPENALLKKNLTPLWIALLVVLGVGVFLLRGQIHFDWRTFAAQMRQADWWLFGAGLLLIYGAYVLRAVRWALFLRPAKTVGLFSLLGTQVIGFTAVAMFGRPADLARPYLVSRRTRIPLPAQVAVWAVERIFDFGSNALIFACILLFAPKSEQVPHPDAVRSLGIAAMVAVAGFIVFALSMRKGGDAVARLFGRIFGMLSPKLGESVREKVLAFRDGLSAVNSFSSFLQALILSLVMWLMIVYSYLETLRAFTASVPLHTMTLARCVVLMLQLPIIGWFTQIGLVAKAIQSFFGVASEPALGAATMLLIITFLGVMPIGLIWSRFEHVSLKKLTEESEHAGVEMAVHPGSEDGFIPEG
jgi:uncharacterized membrane protein YbhN (UPF0104 family)